MRGIHKSILSVIVMSILPLLAEAGDVLRLATTTSLYESGLLDYIIPVFEAKNNCKLHIISVGTGKAIQLGRNGDVDVLLVHAQKVEEAFVNEGFGVHRTQVMYNDFVILGPNDDPAKVRTTHDATEAIRRVYNTAQLFVSRGDDSGTDKKEKYLWSKAGLKPNALWYMETGQGMSATLRIADEKNAYCLVDRSIYLFNKDKIRLDLLFQGGMELLNPYSVIAINPLKHPHTNDLQSHVFINWLTSPECKKMINDYRIGDSQPFFTTSDN
ncbi:substrate-binding domain-containing protein [candidate division KSB1 bacterium]|nr:substrate-binding domain-containing protein [candidate division KSB1 bacterium]